MLPVRTSIDEMNRDHHLAVRARWRQDLLAFSLVVPLLLAGATVDTHPRADCVTFRSSERLAAGERARDGTHNLPVLRGVHGVRPKENGRKNE